MSATRAYFAAGAEWRRVFRLRAEAFGSGTPVHDYDRGRTYMPDGSVVEARRYPTLDALRRARADARVCLDLEASLDDLPSSTTEKTKP